MKLYPTFTLALISLYWFILTPYIYGRVIHDPILELKKCRTSWSLGWSHSGQLSERVALVFLMCTELRKLPFKHFSAVRCMLVWMEFDIQLTINVARHRSVWLNRNPTITLATPYGEETHMGTCACLCICILINKITDAAQMQQHCNTTIRIFLMVH